MQRVGEQPAEPSVEEQKETKGNEQQAVWMREYVVKLEEGGSDLCQDGRKENGAEGGVARRQSPEDHEYCEWK